MLDRLDDDYGLDTIEMGATIGVAMEAGLATTHVNIIPSFDYFPYIAYTHYGYTLKEIAK